MYEIGGKLEGILTNRGVIIGVTNWSLPIGYVYVYMYVCMYVCMYVFIHVCK